MIQAHPAKSKAAVMVTTIVLLTGCARSDSAQPLYYPTSVFGSTLPPLTAYGAPDPYHYRCTSQCSQSF
jgi:hypothetical protein